MTKIFQKLSMLVAALGMAVMVIPTLASAHGFTTGQSFQEKASANVNSSTYNQYGVRVYGTHDGSATVKSTHTDQDKDNDRDNDKDGSRDGHGFGFGGMFQPFFTGTVTATSSTGFTMTTKNNGTVTVNDSGATILTLPNTAISNTNINVGDKVTVNGTLSGSTLTANFVYDKPANKSFASDKGTVTAVSGSTLSVQAKNGATATVDTNSNTQVMNSNGNTTTTSDITVGSNVKIFGIWDDILHVLTALKVWIK